MELLVVGVHLVVVVQMELLELEVHLELTELLVVVVQMELLVVEVHQEQMELLVVEVHPEH
jgi:hypothetical protein